MFLCGAHKQHPLLHTHTRTHTVAVIEKFPFCFRAVSVQRTYRALWLPIQTNAEDCVITLLLRKRNGTTYSGDSPQRLLSPFEC